LGLTWLFNLKGGGKKNPGSCAKAEFGEGKKKNAWSHFMVTGKRKRPEKNDGSPGLKGCFLGMFRLRSPRR